jgi:hypothetical protein
MTNVKSLIFKIKKNMKIYKSGLFVCVALFLFACDKETEGISRPTYYVAFDIQGDNPAIVQAGEKYEDAGVIATLQGKDVTSTVTVNSNVDYDEMGIYQVEYTAVNVDGLKSRAIRDVIVCNPSVTTNISGTYVTQKGTEREALSDGALVPYSGYQVKITYLAPGFFSISDFFGGYYEVRAGYGASYAMTGYVSLSEDNTINLVSSHVNGWGDGLDQLGNGKYDPETGEIIWDAYYVGAYKFHVILNK